MQLEGMFDVPAREKLRQSWNGDVPFDAQPWNVGLIVGPSGAGKSVLARHLFGEPRRVQWTAASLIDDFDRKLSIQEITETCSAVGFNTIPAWMKSYGVLSVGEKFRADLARHLLGDGDPIVIDEFTSVIDRQVAKIGSHAVQKLVRARNRRLVAATCHYDVIDWLQPDWVFEPATMTFQWRAVQRRPQIAVEIARVDRSAWRLFAPFHYMSADLLSAAECFVLFVDDYPAVFCGVRHQPHQNARNIKSVSRVVTLPDFQGLGLAFVLLETLGGAYKARYCRFRNYPAHLAFVRAHDRSPNWLLQQKPATFGGLTGRTSTLNKVLRGERGVGGKTRMTPLHLGGGRWAQGSRPCAVFEYVGPSRPEALPLVNH
jgi:ABC-type lipoprotein export system ATPase subunit